MAGIVNQPALADLPHVARRVSNPDATDTVRGSAEIATQAEQETGTDTVRIVTPGRQHFHQSAAKFWAMFDAVGAVNFSYNTTSVTDTATGNWTLNITTDFSSAQMSVVVTSFFSGSDDARNLHLKALTAGTFNIMCNDSADTLADNTNTFAVGYGDL